jgi:hypothetical protein
MSDKIKQIADKRRKKNPGSVADAIKRAKQHIRNIDAEDLKEPEGFASGDMKKFLENPDADDEGDDCDERK